MKNFHRIILFLFAIIMILAVWTLCGCERPQVGTPEYQDPMADTSPYQPTDEFNYLVDIKGAAERAEARMGELKAEGDLPPEMAEMDVSSVMTELGLDNLEQVEIMSEASEKMVHAHGRYRLESDEMGILDGLAEAGAAEVKLPGYFPKDRWMGHFFLANPDDLLKMAMAEVDMTNQEPVRNDPSLPPMGPGMIPGMPTEDMSMLTEWMGDELVIFNLSNPAYDPNAEASAENVPLFSLIAISTREADMGGLDVIEMLVSNPLLMLLFELNPTREDLNGHDSITIPVPTFQSDMYDETITDEMREQLMGLPPMAFVQFPGYIIFADQPSAEAAIAAFDENGTGTGRLASIEIEGNLDMMLGNFAPNNPGLWLKLLANEALQELLLRVQTETSGLTELGTSRASVVVQDGENFEVDMLTSRESLRLAEILQGIIDDTPQETWDEFGRVFGEWLGEQPGMMVPPPQVDMENIPGEEGAEMPPERGEKPGSF